MRERLWCWWTLTKIGFWLRYYESKAWIRSSVHSSGCHKRFRSLAEFQEHWKKEHTSFNQIKKEKKQA